MNNNDVTYSDSFGVEHIPKDIKEFFQNKNIKTNILRIPANDSVICGYFCIGFIDFMLKGKTLTKFTNLFSLNNFNKMLLSNLGIKMPLSKVPILGDILF